MRWARSSICIAALLSGLSCPGRAKMSRWQGGGGVLASGVGMIRTFFPRRWARAALASLLSVQLLAGAAAADSEELRFSVRLGGVTIGELVLAINTGAGVYAAKGVFHTTGLAGLLARVRFTMTARGQGAPPRAVPEHYSEDMDTGRRVSSSSLSFPPGSGRLDPLTAMLSILRNRPASQGCSFAARTFDGQRVMGAQVRPGSGAHETGLTCEGRLERLSGYGPDELAEAKGFDFSVHFVPDGALLRVDRARTETVHGTVTLVRR
ncbi:MAG: DUF3108 domain-containing protein [Alphaproteobacteria bacterium]|nr:MAG: DUF3108 domain-containing protein [Alphaproteobacteria bacterium]